jgi:hypothetical protein
MVRSKAERIEDQIDDVLGTSLHNEVDTSITVRVSDPQLMALHSDHRSAWRILNGPLTASIIVVLDLGLFHLAWDITEPEEVPIARLLDQGRALKVIIIGCQEPQLSIEVPPVPDELRPNLLTAYIPVSAA